MAYERLLYEGGISDLEIPFSREEIVRMVLNDGKLKGDENKKFEEFCYLLKSIYHFEFHSELESLKKYYRNFNPDAQEITQQQKNESELESKCLASIKNLLVDANYIEVAHKDLEEALIKEGIFPVSSKVNFDLFDYFKIFYQGQKYGKTRVKSWVPFVKKEVKFDYYGRIILFFKVKNSSDLDAENKYSASGVVGKIYLKYFRNIPKLDLEMIFPDPKPRPKLVHKIQIGIPLILGVGIILKEFIIDPYVRGTSPSPLEEGLSVAIIGLLVALFGYAYKTYDEYKKTVVSLLNEIAQSLYFKDIGNNEGVLTALVDAAEEEESKEAILAYYFLLQSAKGLTSVKLDKEIEKWLERKHNTKLDFEISDALSKLEKLNILNCVVPGEYTVPSLEETLKHLDSIWDNYFKYSSSDGLGRS